MMGTLVVPTVTDSCNAKYWGATCDGATDDTTAIQNTVNSCRKVYVPSGTCRITSAITVSTNGIVIEGAGAEISEIKKDGAGCALIVVSSNVVVRDLGFVGAPGNTGNGVCVRSRGFQAQNIGVSKMGGTGLRIGCDTTTGYCNSNFWRVEHATFTNNGIFGMETSDDYGPTSPDANAGHGDTLFFSANSSDGLHVGASWLNTWTNILADHNTRWGAHLSSNAYSNTFIGGDLNEGNTLGSLLIDTDTVNAATYNLELGVTAQNYGLGPLLLNNGYGWSIYGGSSQRYLIVGSSAPNLSGKYAFEVWDKSDKGMTRGDVVVDAINHEFDIGRLSSTPGSSTIFRLTNRTDSDTLYFNTTGGQRGQIGNGANVIGINTDKPGGAAIASGDPSMDNEGQFLTGAGVNKSSFTKTADLIMASGSSITLSGSNGFINVTGSSVTAIAYYGDGSHLTGLVSTAAVTSSFNNFDFKTSGRYTTTAALPANSYNNTNGTITGLSIGLLAIDGPSVAVGDRVLINNEASSSHNGIYTVTANSALVVFVLTRATDFNTAVEMSSGTAIFITSGTVNRNTGWVLDDTVATLGTDPINFVQFTGLGDVTAGTGLSKSANTISLITPISAANLVSTVAYTTIGNTFSASSNTFNFNVTVGSVNVTTQITAASATITGATSASTITIRNDGVTGTGSFPESPLQIYGSANAPVQFVIQNSSANLLSASALVATTDLGGNASFYVEVGINNSKYSSPYYSVQAASSAFVESGDSAIYLWSDTNGAVSGGIGHVVLGSSRPVASNTGLDVSSAVVNVLAQNGELVTYGVTAATGNFTATGNTQYSILTSSGISMAAGCIKYGDSTLQCSATASAATTTPSTQTVSYVNDNFLAQADGIRTVFTLSQAPSSSQSVVMVQDGLMGSTSDYTFAAPATITFTTAPAIACNSNGGATSGCTSSLFAFYTVNTSTLPSVATQNGANVFSTTNTFTLNASSPTTANAIYANTIVKALVCFTANASSTSISYQVNVTSVTRRATGQYTLNFAQPFANSHYGLFCTGGSNSAGTRGFSESDGVAAGGTARNSKIPGQAGLFFWNNSSAFDPDGEEVCCQAIGQQ